MVLRNKILLFVSHECTAKHFNWLFLFRYSCVYSANSKWKCSTSLSETQTNIWRENIKAIRKWTWTWTDDSVGEVFGTSEVIKAVLQLIPPHSYVSVADTYETVPLSPCCSAISSSLTHKHWHPLSQLSSSASLPGCSPLSPCLILFLSLPPIWAL